MPTPAQTRKRATNISLSAHLLEDAKLLGVKVSQACEQGLVLELKKAREAKWLAENREAIESWNEWVDVNGLPLARYRQF
jgi:antitoxin CcdA